MFLLFVVVIASTLFWQYVKGREELASVRAWCDAADAFTDWRLRNPGVFLGLSVEGRILLMKNIMAYERFLRAHRYLDGTDHLEWLRSLFADLPPKHPAPQGKPVERPLADALFLLLFGARSGIIGIGIPISIPI